MPVSFEFPLFRLPFVAFREVLSVTTYYDLIHFSTISKRCLHHVKTLKTTPLTLDIVVNKEHVRIIFKIGGIDSGCWMLNDGGTQEEIQMDVSIAELRFKSIMRDESIHSYVETDFQKHVKVALVYLKELFKITVNRVFLHPDDMPSNRCFPLIPGRFGCKALTISGVRSIDSGEIWNIMENWRVIEQVFLYVRLRNPKKSVRKWKPTRSMHICQNAQWLTFKMVQSLRFVNLIITDGVLTPNECGRFVNLWYKSTNKSLRFLKLDWRNGLPDGFNFANLNLEMPTIPYDEAERHRAYPIHFSTISKRCLHFVKTLKTAPLVLSFRVNKEHVTISFRFGGVHRGSWQFIDGGAQEEIQVKAEIAGLKFESILRRHCIYTYVETDFQKQLKIALVYLKELFKITVNFIHIYPDDIPIARRHPLLPGTFNCKSLTIYGERSIDSDEIWEILEKWTVKENVSLCVELRNPKKSVKKWTWTRSLKIMSMTRNSKWLSFNMMMNLCFANLTLHKCGLNANECGSFINRWYKSTNKSFEFLYLTWDSGTPGDINFPNLNLEMPTMPYDKDERHRAYRYSQNHAINVSEGQDISRNGLLATIRICQYHFLFCVWHERFPNMSGVAIQCPYEPPQP